MYKLLIVAALAAGTVWMAGAQSKPVPAQGRGRVGAPHAWNDKDKDGICDLTGRPLGQGRGFAGGHAHGRRGGGGRGPCGRGAGWGRGAAAAPAPDAAKQ